jgi:hypothetical protein
MMGMHTTQSTQRRLRGVAPVPPSLLATADEVIE